MIWQSVRRASKFALVAVGLTAIGSIAVGMSVAAQTVTTGPSVMLDRYEMAPGERVVLTLDGFESRSVIIAVCGNDARRGSTDCNMPESEGLGIDLDRENTISSMPVAAPPVPCPCIIRVSSANNDEVAVAAITLSGHPVAPVVGTPGIGEPLAVSVVAEAAPDGFFGWVRSSLGGSTPYVVTVSVRNRSTELVDRVALSGSAGRTADNELTTVALVAPVLLEPGQTVSQTVVADLPAPVYGSVEWRVVASGAGPTATALDSTSHQPILLIVLTAILLVDVVIIVVRLVTRRRRNRQDPNDADNQSSFEPRDHGPTNEITEVTSTEPQLVS